MRLFIQIPCLNEEKTLPMVLENMPTQIPGIDDIQLLIVDDGCSDKTVEVARQLGQAFRTSRQANGTGPRVP